MADMASSGPGWGARLKKYTIAFLNWLKHPKNIMELVILLLIIGSGATLVMTMARFPYCADWPQEQINYWVEVCSQTLNACFTFNALRFFIPRGIQLYWCVMLRETRKRKDWIGYSIREEKLLVPYSGVLCALTPEESEEKKSAIREALEAEKAAATLGRPVDAAGSVPVSAQQGAVPTAAAVIPPVPPPGAPVLTIATGADTKEDVEGELSEKSPTSPPHLSPTTPLRGRRPSSILDTLGRTKSSFEEREDIKEEKALAIEMEAVAAPGTLPRTIEEIADDGPPPYPIAWSSMLWILIFLNLNCWFQWPMAFFMFYWATDYQNRPGWGVYTFLVLSFSCMFIGFGWLGYYAYKNNKQWKLTHPKK